MSREHDQLMFRPQEADNRDSEIPLASGEAEQPRPE
ncbi:hypothetical protein BOS5A_110221 [Bosea sp. EC-HK365B]|nr:hypothetical protein BOSE21B_50229 [Bosea sp. 21B]CAD5288127.1 hypothetical protein BOSE46_70222 [Bosea sp. 46]CAD5301488.1 hypothetical protein BOSE7B_90459 [Bosea sp. 7B]VVT51103.1 hypothetical protein BOS5A_110221 [Bosea sp. EC-HK365B]VXB70516.1 hypothetical protein BOSE127_140403 [Bosea sp. 127]VXC57712.1 hypothetical protein BOSE29B_50222 [Bosea sp. 29B]